MLCLAQNIMATYVDDHKVNHQKNKKQEHNICHTATEGV